MIDDHLRPLPIADELTRPFWDASLEGRLAIQRCQRCRKYFHPPLPFCDHCESRELAFETVSGKGTIYSFTRLAVTGVDAFANATPYAVVQVELIEQPWLLLMANVVSVKPDTLAIGAQVQVTFIDVGDGVHLPDFELAPAKAV